MERRTRSAAARITTIEGARSVTKGRATRSEYGASKRDLISRSSKVGKSRFA